VRNRASSATRALVLAHERVRGAGVIFCYVSVGAEVDTRALIDAFVARGQTVVIPCCVDRTRMETSRFLSWSGMVAGRLGIPASAAGPDYSGPVDLVLTPGLAFTPAGARLGYGAGYYDRWFARHPTSYRIGLAHPVQLTTVLPCEPHDVFMHEVVSARGAGEEHLDLAQSPA
jgi:5-formyltetrahydrofolate cyclo-ligase